MNPFIVDLCTYLAPNIPGLTFGDGNTNFKAGELIRGMDGIFAVDAPSAEPDRYTAVTQRTIDFWAVFRNTETAYNYLLQIYDFLHQKHHYNTTSYTVHFSFAGGQVQDLDRDAEGRKLLKLSVVFIVTGLIS